MKDEKQIVKRLKQGDETAFRTLYDSYHPRLYSFSLKFVHDPEAAREIVQDVFLKIWSNRRTLNPQLSFPAYLFKIAKHENFKYLKNAARETSLKEELIRRALPLQFLPEDQLIFTEYQAMAEKAIQLLPPKRRLVFEMAQQGLTHDEIALELGISVHTVRAQLTHATQSVKDYFMRFAGVALTVALFLFFGLL